MADAIDRWAEAPTAKKPGRSALGKVAHFGLGGLRVAGGALGAPQQALFKTIKGVTELDPKYLLQAGTELATLGQAGGHKLNLTETLNYGRPGETTGRHAYAANSLLRGGKLPFGVETLGSTITDPTLFIGAGAKAGAKAGIEAATRHLGEEAAQRLVREGAKRGLSEVERATLRKALISERGAKAGAKVFKATEASAQGGVRVGAGRFTKTLVTGERIAESPLGAAGRTVKFSPLGRVFSTTAAHTAAFGEKAAEALKSAASRRTAREEQILSEGVNRLSQAARATEGGLTAADDRALQAALDIGGQGKAQLEPRLHTAFDALDAWRHELTGIQVAEGVLKADAVHNTAEYVHRLLTPESQRLIRKRGAGRVEAVLRKGGNVRGAGAQEGATLARRIFPELSIQEANVRLRELAETEGPILGKKVSQGAAKRAQRAATKAERAAQSKLQVALKKGEKAGAKGAKVEAEGAVAARVEGRGAASKIRTADRHVRKAENRAARLAKEAAAAPGDKKLTRQALNAQAKATRLADKAAEVRAALGPVKEAGRLGARTVEAARAAERSAGKAGRRAQAQFERAQVAAAKAAERAKVAREAAEARAGKAGIQFVEGAIEPAVVRTGKAARAIAAREYVDALGQITDDAGERILLSAEDFAKARPAGAHTWKEVDLGVLGKVHVHPELAGEIEHVARGVTEPEIHGFFRFLGRAEKVWKAAATTLPIGGAFPARNARGNFWLNYLDGLHDPRWYVRAGRLQKKVHGILSGAEHSEEVARDGVDAALRHHLSDAEYETYRRAQEHGVLSSTFSRTDLSAGGRAVPIGKKRTGLLARVSPVKREARPGGPIRRFLRAAGEEAAVPERSRLYRAGANVNQAVEENARLANFMFNMDRLGDATEAASHVKKFLFDYNDLTPFERKVFKKVMPFYTFMRKNTALQLEQFVKQPGKYALSAHLAGGFLGENAGRPVPEYLRQGGGGVLPPAVARALGAGRNPLITSPDNPFAEAARTVGLVPAALAALPGGQYVVPKELRGEGIAREAINLPGGPIPGLARAAAEQVTGKSLFTGGKVRGGGTRRLAEGLYPGVGRAESARKGSAAQIALRNILGLHTTEVTAERARAALRAERAKRREAARKKRGR